MRPAQHSDMITIAGSFGSLTIDGELLRGGAIARTAKVWPGDRELRSQNDRELRSPVRATHSWPRNPKPPNKPRPTAAGRSPCQARQRNCYSCNANMATGPCSGRFNARPPGSEQTHSNCWGSQRSNAWASTSMTARKRRLSPPAITPMKTTHQRSSSKNRPRRLTTPRAATDSGS